MNSSVFFNIFSADISVSTVDISQVSVDILLVKILKDTESLRLRSKTSLLYKQILNLLVKNERSENL
jgi:hypothetical protein